MNIYPLPAFTDNYIWALVDGAECWIVDPGQAAPVTRFLAAHNLTLAGLLITHHHGDHTGAISELSATGVRVIGPDNPTINGITEVVGEGDTVDVFGYTFHCLAVPGHTLDHVAYHSELGSRHVLFCGDTLFAGGCGRLFEGSPEQMWQSLGKLANLPDRTEVYAAHEYTAANLAFAAAVDPNNRQLAARIEDVAACRRHGIATLPSRIGLEKATNPFLRATQAELAHAASKAAGHPIERPVEVFAALRAYKDRF